MSCQRPWQWVGPQGWSPRTVTFQVHFYVRFSCSGPQKPCCQRKASVECKYKLRAAVLESREQAQSLLLLILHISFLPLPAPLLLPLCISVKPSLKTKSPDFYLRMAIEPWGPPFLLWVSLASSSCQGEALVTGLFLLLA